MFNIINRQKQVIAAVIAIFLTTALPASVQAHLMVAQHGTLNFLDDSVYLVISLPASAFADGDLDKDDKLSLTEFAEHRTKIIEAVSKNVILSNKEGNLALDGILVSPATPHDAPTEPAAQIIVLGRFTLTGEDDKLKFHVGLFGNNAEEQIMEIAANRKAEELRHVFELTPEKNTIKLEFN